MTFPTTLSQSQATSSEKPLENVTESPAPLPQKVVLTLDHCLLPDDKLRETPSMRHGLNFEDEVDLRHLGCELIQSSGILLRLPQVAMATGQVLFQRYYYNESFVKHNMWYTSMACIALASKIEEAPRRLRDVINVFNHLKQKRLHLPVKAIPLDHKYIELKNNVIIAERRVLNTLGFCVHIKHPHKFIVTLLQVLGYGSDDRLLQSSWNFMNDCLRTDVFVRQTPETIACSCIYLSARILKVPLPSDPSWFSIFDVNEDDIQDTCKRILGVYGRPKPDQLLLEQKIAYLQAKLVGEKETLRFPEVRRVTAIREVNSKTNTPTNEDTKSADELQDIVSSENSQDLQPHDEPQGDAHEIPEVVPSTSPAKFTKHSRDKSKSPMKSLAQPVLQAYHDNHHSEEEEERNENHRRKEHKHSTERESRHRRREEHYDKYEQYVRSHRKRDEHRRYKEYDDYYEDSSRRAKERRHYSSSRRRSRSPRRRHRDD